MDIHDHSSLIEALGGGAEVARARNELPHADDDWLPGTVRAWVARNRIPPEAWPDIIAISGRFPEISADWLMRNIEPRRSPAAIAA